MIRRLFSCPALFGLITIFSVTLPVTSRGHEISSRRAIFLWSPCSYVRAAIFYLQVLTSTYPRTHPTPFRYLQPRYQNTITMSTATPTSDPTESISSPSPKQMSRLELHIKTLIFRFFQTIGRWCDHYLSPPLPSSPSFKIKIPSTVGSVPGKIPLLFYTPKSYSPSSDQSRTSPGPASKQFPVVINFHGGGYTSKWFCIKYR